MQLVFMLVAVGLGTFALVRALRLALNKDTLAMRHMPKRPRQIQYEMVRINDEAIEDSVS